MNPRLKIAIIGILHRGGFGGGGGHFLSGIRPPADPKGPLCTTLRYQFLETDPKIFLEAFWRQYT